MKNALWKLIESNKNMVTKLNQVESANMVLVHEFSKLNATVKSLVLAISGQKIPDMDDLFPIKKMENLEKIIRLSQSSEDFPLKLVISDLFLALLIHIISFLSRIFISST